MTDNNDKELTVEDILNQPSLSAEDSREAYQIERKAMMLTFREEQAQEAYKTLAGYATMNPDFMCPCDMGTIIDANVALVLWHIRYHPGLPDHIVDLGNVYNSCLQLIRAGRKSDDIEQIKLAAKLGELIAHIAENQNFYYSFLERVDVWDESYYFDDDEESRYYLEMMRFAQQSCDSIVCELQEILRLDLSVLIATQS